MTKPMNISYYSSYMIELVKHKQRINNSLIKKVDINYRDKNKRNALYWAIKNRSRYNMSLLIEHKIELMVTPQTHAIFYALESKNVEGLLLLLQHGVDLNSQNHKGQTPLMVALKNECILSVQYLLAYDADLYIMDYNYDMAIDYAKRCKDKKIFELVYYKELYEKIKDKDLNCVGCPIAKKSNCKIEKES